MNRKRITFAAVLVTLIGLFGLALPRPAVHVVPGAPTVSTVVDEPEEDDPAFDCHLHGNRICGPINTNAPAA